MYSKVTVTLPQDMTKDELIMRFNALCYENNQLKNRVHDLRKELMSLAGIIFDRGVSPTELTNYWTKMMTRIDRVDEKK